LIELGYYRHVLKTYCIIMGCLDLRIMRSHKYTSDLTNTAPNTDYYGNEFYET
jgi:hypothetical protein